MNHEKIFELISQRQVLLGKLKKLDKEIVENLNKNNNGNALVDEAYPLGYDNEEFLVDEGENETDETTEFGLGGDWWK